MPTNIAFGPVSVPANLNRDFGPYTVKAQDSSVMLTIDRTVTNGLDATPGAEIDIAINQSVDGGQTWTLVGGGRVVGGVITWTDRQGTVHQYTQSTTGGSVASIRGSQIKATVSTGDAPVSVSGTFVVN